MSTLLLLTFLALAASAELALGETGDNGYEKRYLVFSGLDATPGEVAEWFTGWAAPFNILFGPKPYVIGWSGEGGTFKPESDDSDIEYPDIEYPDGEDPDGEDPDGEDPDGEDSDGEDSDGEDSDGENPDEEDPDGEGDAGGEKPEYLQNLRKKLKLIKT